jgi:hypothetical protein
MARISFSQAPTRRTDLGGGGGGGAWALARDARFRQDAPQ